MTNNNNRPGDEYNANGEGFDLLLKHGWKVVCERDCVKYLCRPGKDSGVSATFNKIPGKLYVFSTNADPFEPEKAYDGFSIYAILEHNGDYSQAASTLAGRGYGSLPEKIEPMEENPGDFLRSTPLLPESVYAKLPALLRDFCNQAHDERERDILLLGALATISGCLGEAHGFYDGKRVFANLFLFISAPPSCGKGMLRNAKDLALPIHQKIRGDDEPDEKKPKMLFLPGNSSSSALIAAFARNNQQGIVFETEADTLNSALGQDWGDFSYVLRNTFHHEHVALLRKTKSEYLDLHSPRLSVVLSGTPGQLTRLFQSSENGLFSRFCFYCYDQKPEWRQISFEADESGTSIVASAALSTRINTIYWKLSEQGIQFRCSNSQKQQFNILFHRLLQRYSKDLGPNIVASVKRMGLISFRVSMILSLLRLDDLPEGNNIECDDKSFECAMSIVETLLEHAAVSLKILTSQPQHSKPVNPEWEKILSKLPEKFTRKKAINASKGILTTRTVDRFLSDEISVKKDGYGKYKKMSGLANWQSSKTRGPP